MGAWGHTFHQLKTRAECEAEVKSFCEEEDAERKTVKFYDKEFKTFKEAEEYADQHTDKWGDAAAVSYFGLPEKLKESASKKKFDLLSKVNIPEKLKEIGNQTKKMGELRASAEPEFVKCPGCESKINSKHLVPFSINTFNMKADTPEYSCPACRLKGLLPKFLKTEYKSLEKLYDELFALREKTKQLNLKMEEENLAEKYWVVSVLFGST
jgi:hypothetical protein